jgi:hypothetical protein
MGLSRLLRGDDHKVFAKTLVDTMVKRYPPALDQQPDKRPSVNRMTRIVEDACKQAVAYGSAGRLGWMGRSRLANAVRWELVDVGYSKEFVDLATEAIVVSISRKAVA